MRTCFSFSKTATLRPAAFAIATLLTTGATLAQVGAPVIDFSSVRGSGTSQSDVLMENVRLLVPVPNPFQPGTTTTVESSYNIMFRFDPNTLHLVPVDLSQTGGEGAQLCATADVSVFNAVQGANVPVANALVTLGRQTVQTNAQGVASFTGLPQSIFSVHATAGDYVPASQPVVLSCDAPNNLAVALSPSVIGSGGLGVGQFRTILTWGENPRDLDSHLTGPGANGTDRWHVYYANKEGGDMCGLDVDDVSSYGPETVTCPRTDTTGTQLRPGVYRYSVHHYSGSGNIPTSGANVRLEFAGGQRYDFFPPAGAYLGAKDVWTVFEVTVQSNGTTSVAPVNAVMNSVSSSQVRSGNTAAGEEKAVPQFGSAENRALLRGMPGK